MIRINVLALLAMNLLAIVFIYKRVAAATEHWLLPVVVSVLLVNVPALLACAVDYLANKKFNSRMYNNINYFFIFFFLLALFFPNILKMG